AILGVNSFEFLLTVTPSPLYRGFLVEGTIKASVVQECITTLKPVTETVETSIDLVLRPKAFEKQDEQFENFEEEKDVDYFENGKYDLAELASQYLALNLNPYPKALEA
ncbi:MAG TPA: YceD family protein, partial [Alphaproteobacteria bacterium]|nr:YceD family protein [Alphaproteobacteria bacterium]